MAKKTPTTATKLEKKRASKRRAASAPTNGRKKDADVIKRLEGVAQTVVDAARKGKDPSFDIPVRSLSNIYFDTERKIIQMGKSKQSRNFFNLGLARKFMQTVLVASECKNLKLENKTGSVRHMYYRCKHTIAGSKTNTFDNQAESDPIVEDLEVTLDCLREELNLHASNKGAMVGELTLVDAGDTIDVRHMGSGGWSIPSIVEPNVIQFKKCTAKFILLVEKDTEWRRFNEDKFWKKHKCILLHGGGQPPRGVRRLLFRMANELKLPLYVLVDNDPWGYYIYSVVKQGSINLAYESKRMAVPQARFIGLSAFDAQQYAIPSYARLALDKRDGVRAKEILGYEWFQKKPWKREIKKMLSNGFKMELEALCTRGISFITEEYLPKKIRDKDYLD